MVQPPLVERFLAAVWGEQRGWVDLPYRHKGRWAEELIDSPSFGLLHLPGHATQQADQYFCPLVFNHPARKAEYALPTHVLWADLDAAPPQKCRLIPSVAWKSSRGRFQAIWFLDREVTAADAAALSKRIAYAEPGCDRSGWDVTQVLRLPGTLNHKYDPPQPVEFLWAKKTTYTVEQVEKAYPQRQPVTKRVFTVTVVPEVAPDYIRTLPVGLQIELEKQPDGRDRSAHLFRIAGLLLDFDVPPAVAVELLRRSAWNKFRGRDDETKQLRSTVAAAMERSNRAYQEMV